jgi:hypothetical protein
MKKFAALLASILSLASAGAEKIPKLPVSIHCLAADDDWIGERLCTALRDGIASSPRYRETDETGWVLLITSRGITRHDADASAQAVVLLQPSGMYLISYVLVTGADAVEQQAKQIIAAFDQDVQGAMSDFKKNARPNSYSGKEQ